MTLVKICGLKTPETVSAAAQAGADFIGFVFYPPSPRAVTPAQAGALANVAGNAKRVGLFVDPSDDELTAAKSVLALDMVQLHGTENPARVAEIKALVGLPVMKAVGVSHSGDIVRAREFERTADWLLFDAKPPRDSGLPGGTGQSFDWGIMRGNVFSRPWMLSGGLNAENVAAALLVLNPDAVDVSSGVEHVRGEKDPDKIREFIRKVKVKN